MSTQTKLRTVTAEQASALWADLRGSFINAEKRIVEIIELKAWEPLGFESFTEAWASKMSGIRLASEELRAHVVYAMFADDLSDDEIIDQVGPRSGVSDRQVKLLRRQHGDGVPATLARTRVRSHLRKRPSTARTIHVQFDSDEYLQFREIAVTANLTVEGIAAEAIRNAFKEMR